MRYIKYDEKDLLEIRAGHKTIKDIADKYNVSVHAIRCAMSRLKVYKKKTMVKLTTAYKEVICSSTNECARIVGVSQPTIKKALRGEYSRILNELEVEVEEYIPYAQEEYDD